MIRKILFVCCLCAAGCRKEEPIVTYRLAKDSDSAARAASPSATSPMSGAPMAAAREDRVVTWTLPAGWTEQPPSDMRVGSFLVKGAGGRVADVSIVPLAGDAGGDVSNINRWRGQLNLAPIAGTDMEKATQRITAAGRRMRVVDIANGGKRLIAAIYATGETTWFFKMMGDDALVKANKPAFLHFLSSIKMNAHD